MRRFVIIDEVSVWVEHVWAADCTIYSCALYQFEHSHLERLYFIYSRDFMCFHYLENQNQTSIVKLKPFPCKIVSKEAS